MTKRNDIVEFLNQELLHPKISDSGMNGLQFEGTDEVRRVALAVDSGLSIIERAAQEKAELLLVHHGLFWEKPFAVTGPSRKLFATLLENNLNLYAAHLPLDAHEQWGNNFVLARYLALSALRSAIPYRGTNIGCIGENSQKKTREELQHLLQGLPGGKLFSSALSFGPKIPKRVCIVTGSGADALYCAEAEGFDTLITGEPRQFAYHFAKERDLNVIFAGHYATETVGVAAVGKALEEKFRVSTVFIDEPTGI